MYDIRTPAAGAPSSGEGAAPRGMRTPVHNDNIKKNHTMRKRPVPKFETTQRVTVPGVTGETLCLVRQREWHPGRKTWTYVCVTADGRRVTAAEDDVAAAGPQPVGTDMGHAIYLQKEALAAAIAAALDTAVGDDGCDDVAVTRADTSYRGLVRDDDGVLCTTDDKGVAVPLNTLGAAILMDLYDAYRRLFLRPLPRPGEGR